MAKVIPPLRNIISAPNNLLFFKIKLNNNYLISKYRISNINITKINDKIYIILNNIPRIKSKNRPQYSIKNTFPTPTQKLYCTTLITYIPKIMPIIIKHSVIRIDTNFKFLIKISKPTTWLTLVEERN